MCLQMVNSGNVLMLMPEFEFSVGGPQLPMVDDFASVPVIGALVNNVHSIPG